MGATILYGPANSTAQGAPAALCVWGDQWAHPHPVGARSTRRALRDWAEQGAARITGS